MTFGRELASLRRRERLSQLALAQRSGVSQRHISFLESGRTRPGPKAVALITRALDLTYAEVNLLFEHAGLKPPRNTFELEDEAFASAQTAIDLVLRKHAPFPAAATLRGGQIIQSNQPFEAALDWSFDGARPWRAGQTGPVNLFELTLHPEGLFQFMVNPEEIVPHTLRRLRMAAAQNQDAALTLNRLRQYESLSAYTHAPEPPASAGASVLIEQYLIKGAALNLVSMVASFGSPEDVTAQAVQIELFFPEDTETDAALQAIASGARPEADLSER